MQIDNRLLITAALFGGTGVILGSLGAHALKGLIEPVSIESFNTGVRYQLYHALFLMILAILSNGMKQKMKNAIYYLITSGIVFFSGSIYLLNIGPVVDINFRFLGPITPIGGLMLISAWILLIFSKKT